MVLLDDLLAVAIRIGAFCLRLIGRQRLLFLLFEALVGLLDTHRPGDDLLPKAEVGLVKHVDGELNGLGAEVHWRCDLVSCVVGQGS